MSIPFDNPSLNPFMALLVVRPFRCEAPNCLVTALLRTWSVPPLFRCRQCLISWDPSDPYRIALLYEHFCQLDGLHCHVSAWARGSVKIVYFSPSVAKLLGAGGPS